MRIKRGCGAKLRFLSGIGFLGVAGFLVGRLVVITVALSTRTATLVGE